MRPTKFDLMRAGRERLSAIQREPSIFDGLLSESNEVRQMQIWKPKRYSVETQEAPQPAPVPTMQIDGVRYREAPETDTCKGCAFYNGPHCAMARSIDSEAGPVFGGNCVDRNVIYIRAE